MKQAQRDPLDALCVFDRLEVGPVRVERRRLVAPYCVVGRRGSAKTELIYRFEVPVFDPREAASHNLASLLGAQVALNYGLFCRRLVFRGTYDQVDRRFLEAMAENTAREIYVKKFLEPNPFLLGPAATLPALCRPRYLRAALEFPESPANPPPAVFPAWPTSQQRHAVLSSGGKESLLTFGLLDELGREAHPIFINESGRHWYTALNGYRRFRREVPETARVWVNSDRVFVWMLRQMPFIRRDFATLRSDEYPIRLWTVAVFLFGALPLLRRRGIGRLLIGDEYDTTRRAVHRGIPHYDGLYDQSRYFDYALTRYYRQKGWGVMQFSLLRPLSEMLGQQILALRYPKLQAEQVSCHATHLVGERAYPCGRCEKCRRVVGMLSAVGADPRRCGYTEEQIGECLAALGSVSLHQEALGAEQIAHLLIERGVLPQPPGKPPREHPEIMKLRFDRERARLEDIPPDLRVPFLRICLEHAAGALRRSGSRWVAFDPLAEAES